MWWWGLVALVGFLFWQELNGLTKPMLFKKKGKPLAELFSKLLLPTTCNWQDFLQNPRYDTGSYSGFHYIKSNETLSAAISTNQPIHRFVWRWGFDLYCTHTNNYPTQKSLLVLPYSTHRQASVYRSFSFFQALLQAQQRPKASLIFIHLSLVEARGRLANKNFLVWQVQGKL